MVKEQEAHFSGLGDGLPEIAKLLLFILLLF